MVIAQIIITTVRVWILSSKNPNIDGDRAVFSPPSNFLTKKLNFFPIASGLITNLNHLNQKW